MAQAVAVIANIKPILFVKSKAEKIKQKWNASGQRWRTYKLQSEQMKEKMSAFEKELKAYNQTVADATPIVEEHGKGSKTGLMLAKYLREEAQELQKKASDVFEAENPLFESINDYYKPRISKATGWGASGFVGVLFSYFLWMGATVQDLNLFSKILLEATSLFTAMYCVSGAIVRRLDAFFYPWENTWQKVTSIKEKENISSLIGREQ